ncbi:MAG: sialate O-acetylesterase, partial [Woeseiaceae bacterium]
VWLASGQSNMELPMVRVQDMFAADIANADYPLVRHFTVPKEYEFAGPRADLAGGAWQRATPDSVMNLSAAGYFFARSLHQRYDVPIGLIVSAYGGSAAESWMSESALEAYPHYLEIARGYQDAAYLQSLIEADQAAADAWYGGLEHADAGLAADVPWYDPVLDDSAWQAVVVPGFFTGELAGSGSVWLRRTVKLPPSVDGAAALLNLGRIKDADTVWVNGTEVGGITYEWPPRRYALEPGVLRPGANTITIRVVVNSAGEAGPVPDKAWRLEVGGRSIDLSGTWRARVGARRPPIQPQQFVQYRQPLGFYNAMLAPLLPMTIKGVIWYQGETNVGRADEYAHLFPAMIRNWRADFGQGDFPFLFVQLANFLEPSAEPVESSWAELRAAQTRALAEPNTAMVTAIDIGAWNDIHPLDKKTVAERLVLAARAVAYGEKNVVYSGPTYRSATQEGNRVVVSFDNVGGGLRSRGDKLEGFAVAGPSGEFAWADARIDGDRVVVRSDEVSEPAAIRYAWADNPDTANLYNAAGLPAVPFEATVD